MEFILLSDFLSNHSIAAVVDSHHSSLKYITSSVPQASVLFPILFPFFFNDLPFISSLIHSSDDDSTLHYSFQFDRRPSKQQLIDARKVASDLSCISNWGRENM